MTQGRAKKPRARVTQADADRVAREAGGITAADFARIVKIAEAAGSRPTTREQNAACAAIGPLTSRQKVFVVRGFCFRDEELRRKGGQGDRVAWVFVAGCIGREALPFDRSDVVLVLELVRQERRVLPPQYVVRIVQQYIRAHGPLDRDLSRFVARAAKSMWPDDVDDGAEGANFRKAAAQLRALIA